ncbi:DUF3221 domain-containing protein [Neobacillus sp. D3-1R]|uniref:DUF3221 domain-containing protein n=1 Tax=Neobacillus sp. D3-1R TaxID=3445778 RepID=UPI003FA176A8
MKKHFIIFIFLCLCLTACGGRNGIKGAIDIKGTVIDTGDNQILVNDAKAGLIWVSLPQNDKIEEYVEGQEVVIWTTGNIRESFPAQASALNIEVTKEVDNSKKPTFEFDDQFPPATPGYIKIGDTLNDLAKGGFQWKKGNSVVTTDAASPLQIAESYKPIEADQNTEAIIIIGQNPNLKIYSWTTKEDVPVEKNKIIMPVAEGKYIYEVQAKWTNGEVSYTFVVEIK